MADATTQSRRQKAKVRPVELTRYRGGLKFGAEQVVT